MVHTGGTKPITPPCVPNQETSAIERGVLRKLLIDLFYATPRNKSKLASAEETRKENVPHPQEGEENSKRSEQ